RKWFTPSEHLAEPYVIVSADAGVPAADATARELAKPYGAWVHGIRTGEGAIPYPTPAEAGAAAWSDADRARGAHRGDTQFAGVPALRRVHGADELLITAVPHDPAGRVRSQELLAGAWRASG